MENKINDIIKVLERLDDLFYNAIESVSHRLNVKDPFGELTMTQTQAVFKIGKITPCTLSDAAATLRISKSSASTLVERLVIKGALERNQDPDNRRRVLITIPKDAQNFLAALNTELIEEMKKVIAIIGSERFLSWHAVFKDVEVALKTIQDRKSDPEAPHNP